MALLAARTAASEAKSLALEAATPYGSPRSIRSAQRHTSSRAASASSEMSAIMSCTSWKPAIGRPNWVRLGGVLRPTPPGSPARCRRSRHATARRPLSRVLIAILKPWPTSPSTRGGRHPYVGEEQLGGGLAAQPELALDLAGLEAGGVGRHQERRHAARAVVAGAREDQRDVGPGAVGDEELLAVDDVVVAVPGRARGEVAGVGAGVGLGEPEAAELGRRRRAAAATPASAPRCRGRGSTCRPARCSPTRCRAGRSRRGRAPPWRGRR